MDWRTEASKEWCKTSFQNEALVLGLFKLQIERGFDFYTSFDDYTITMYFGHPQALAFQHS